MINLLSAPGASATFHSIECDGSTAVRAAYFTVRNKKQQSLWEASDKPSTLIISMDAQCCCTNNPALHTVAQR